MTFTSVYQTEDKATSLCVHWWMCVCVYRHQYQVLIGVHKKVEKGLQIQHNTSLVEMTCHKDNDMS